MAFNPIRDLSKVDRDQSIKQLGGATQDEITVIANRLKTTTRLTSQLLEVIRRKNALFKTDLEQIKTLDRRIKRVIPIIPGMTGVAGARFGRGGRGPDGQGPSMPGIPLFPTGPIGTGPRGPRPTPTETPVEQPIGKEEEERRRQEEESKVESKVLTPEEISEALEEIYGVPAEERVLSPAIIQDPRTGLPITVQPGEPLYPYPDPGKTPVILQDVITALQEEAKREKKGQVYQTPDGFLVIVDKNGVPKVISPKQLKEQREAIKNDPGAQFLILSQALMDALPPSVGRVPMRDRRSPFTQSPGSGTTPGRTRVNRVENRIINLRRDRIRREAAARAKREADAAATRAERLKRSNAKIERRRQQEEARKERARQRELERQRQEELERQSKVDEEVARMEQSPEVMEQVAKADAERAEREFAIEKYFGRKINVDSSEYDVAAAELRTKMQAFLDPEFNVPLRSGSVGFIMGLDKPESRSKFIDYLLGANAPKGKDINVNFINGILKAVGLETTGVDAIDATTTRFIFDYMQSRNLGDKINDVYDDFNSRGLLRLDTVERVKIKKKFNITETGQQLEFEVNQEQQPVGEQSFRGTPLSMDIASLNSQIDNTDVVIVLTGTTT